MLATYDITDADRKPNVSLVSWRIEDEGDNDGRFDSGETIKFYPTLRNEWGTAENVVAWMELGDQEGKVVEFSQAMTFSSKPLSSYAKTEMENPIVFKVSDNVVDGRHIRLVLYAQCDGMDEPSAQEIVITAENGVEIGGMIDHDTTLEAGMNYIITSNIAIPAGVTLTIMPGAKIKNRDWTTIRCEGKLIANGTKEDKIIFYGKDYSSNLPFLFIENGNGCIEFRYCVFDNIWLGKIEANVIDNCQFKELVSGAPYYYFFGGFNYQFILSNSNIMDDNHKAMLAASNIIKNIKNTNFLNNQSNNELLITETVFDGGNNVLNNRNKSDILNIVYDTPEINVLSSNKPSYFGSSIVQTVRKSMRDFSSGNGYGQLDFSNMLTQPNPDAHGIVWKVCVNGYDAQDEFDQLPPLGVGRHKFEVWYSKKIDETEAPMIAMGVRPPYTQTAIAEDGEWRTETSRYVVKDSEGNVTEDREVEHSVYTAYLTIKGGMAIDGLNRIYVEGCQDLEYFDIPLENTRFNVEVAAAGSMSTGFFAEPGVGKVTLTWEDQDENVDDILGYNMYRYTERPGTNEDGYYDEDWNWIIPETVQDTIKINQRLLTETEYVDYDVVPGKTYNYYYKILRTSLTENSPSKVVAVTPVTASKGDANGSMSVDVADVVTEVSYLTGGNPQPFIFEAADVNSDNQINILDIVGTINIIVNPSSTGIASIGGEAIYSVEDGILYVETPISLGGIQISLAPLSTGEGTGVRPLAALDGFEQVYCNGLFLAYSMSGKTLAPGKHALLQIGEAEIEAIVLSDAQGHNVEAVAGGTATAVAAAKAAQTALGVPYGDTIPYYINEAGRHNVRIAIYDSLGHIQHIWNGVADSGKHSYTWNDRTAAGVYLAVLSIDGRHVGATKIIKQ